ncbi:Uncharacterised protein [Haploplasma axanthum]|uniref:SatD family (SatD) n=2 Tax=Haploplasma axanthum TaxID=29552 RepID=A0A449BF80_HAPAX|nr:Uncharacterised protein [Haploplasma axanthum]
MEKQKYFTIRADIKNSSKNKKYEELNDLVGKTNQTLSKIINNNKAIISFKVRFGDEIFAVYDNLHDGIEAYQILLYHALSMEIPLYIGCGYGTLEKITNDEHLINGESIWFATDAIESIKDILGKYNEKLNIKTDVRIKFNISSDNKKNRNVQNIFYVISDKIAKRTEQQHRAVNLIKENKQLENYQLYDILEGNINYQNTDKEKEEKRIKFTKYLQRAEYYFVNDLIKTLIYLIKGEW